MRVEDHIGRYKIDAIQWDPRLSRRSSVAVFSFTASRNLGAASPNRARLEIAPENCEKSARHRLRITINQWKRDTDHLSSGRACAFDVLSVAATACVLLSIKDRAHKCHKPDQPSSLSLSPSLSPYDKCHRPQPSHGADTLTTPYRAALS